MRGERLFEWLLRVYPPQFRAQYRDDLLAFFREEARHPKYGGGPLRPLRFWAATLRDLFWAATSERLAARSAGAGGGPRQLLRSLLFDVRYAVRSLAGTPAVTLTALAVLTLGIGVSAAIFSVVDGVILRGLPYPDEDRLVAVQETDESVGVLAAQGANLGLQSGRPVPAAYQNYIEWAAHQTVFAGLAASVSVAPLTTADAERPEQLRSHRISANLFDVLGVRPALGRGFTDEDIAADAKIAVISHDVWQRRFGGATDVLGRTIAFETGTYTVVGVMGPRFLYPVGAAVASRIDLWVPLVPGPRDTVRTEGRSYFTRVVGRLKPEVSVTQAAAQMTQIRNALAVQHPKWFADRGILVRPLKDAIVPASARSWMMMLLTAVVVVFLVACANVANLLLARASSRTREIGVRAAMGATRGQIVRALMVESLVLALAGACGGVLLAYWGVDILRTTLPASLPRVWLIAVDLRVIAAAAAAALATGCVCGLVPALQMSRTDVSVALRAGGRSATGSVSSTRARNAFLVCEVALATALLVGAGIFASSFIRLINTELGFSAGNVLSVSVSPRMRGGPASPDELRQRAEQQLREVLERVASAPGVSSAALVAGGAPLTGSWSSQPVRVGASQWTGQDEVILKEVTHRYFETIGAQVLAGRAFSADDTKGSPAVVILSDEAVRRYFGGRDPLGAQLTIDRDRPRTVVGVVRGMRLLGPESDIRPEAYIPFDQVEAHSISASLLVATSGSPSAAIPAIKDAIWQAMPSAVIPEPTTFDQLFATMIAQRKLNMILIGLFGLLALSIATIGVYGVLAYVVEGRRKEIGVRMALGAVPSRIMSLVLSRAAAVIGIGLGLGFLLAAWLERLVMAFVYRGVAHDPVVYGAAALLLLSLGLAAAYVPARRAARVDPLIALRAE